jgi:adenylate cyclase
MQVFLRRLQLGSGLVMLTYLSLHLVNHTLGIWSLDLAGRGLVLALRLWRSTPGTIALYGAASLHFALALHTLYGRRHWALPPAEWIRLWAGLSLPMLLIRHAVTTRLASTLYGFEPDYERVIVALLAFMVLLPVLSAAGFIRMMRAVEGKSRLLPRADPTLVAHQAALGAWRHDLLVLYLAMVASALILGRLRNGLERRRLRRSSLSS